MELTGKCRKAFEDWYPTRSNDIYRHTGRSVMRWFYYDNFDKNSTVPFIEQYSIYVDFFDTVGIIIHSGKPTRSGEWEVFINSTLLLFETRQDTRIGVIQKANEIYNLNN